MENESLIIATKSVVCKIAFTDIVHIESTSMCTTTHTLSGDTYRCSKNLGAIFMELNKSQLFFRVHTSYVVNLTKIKFFEKKDRCVVMMVNGSEIPVSKRRKRDFLRKYTHRT